FQDESADSHGTFLASIVADCTRNLPIKIMPVRVLGTKTGSLINVINGIMYAVDNGADVINISLGAILNNCRSLEEAIEYAENNNVTVVVCAGNAKSDAKDFCPAHIENVLTVSSINSDFVFSESFSNFGDGIDFAAPGENITGYNAFGKKSVLSGTSMSTAFIAAAAAMFRLDNPGCNNKQVHEALVLCAEDYGETGRDAYYGWGVPKLKSLIKPLGLKIKNNIGSKTINYGETLRLSAETPNRPNNTFIWWYVDGDKRGEGNTFEVSPKNGGVEVTAKLVYSNGVAVKDLNENEIYDSQKVFVNSGFFQKIISFFKDLFKINRTVTQALITL
ncbi:MAG: S8 family serine peptidase, partial [Clostridia bacterium]|nr:S8 family serine peptidase [Clostridia bacterium]